MAINPLSERSRQKTLQNRPVGSRPMIVRPSANIDPYPGRTRIVFVNGGADWPWPLFAALFRYCWLDWGGPARQWLFEVYRLARSHIFALDLPAGTTFFSALVLTDHLCLCRLFFMHRVCRANLDAGLHLPQTVLDVDFMCGRKVTEG